MPVCGILAPYPPESATLKYSVSYEDVVAAVAISTDTVQDHDARLLVNQTVRDQESFCGTYVQKKALMIKKGAREGR